MEINKNKQINRYKEKVEMTAGGNRPKGDCVFVDVCLLGWGKSRGDTVGYAAAPCSPK